MTDAILTQEELKNIISYNPETGIFTWQAVRGIHDLTGLTAGTLHKNGYIYIVVNYKKYFSHRLAWFYMNGKWPKNYIDHINRIKNDNRIVNLREATHSQNNFNSTSRASNKLGVKGVHFDAGRNKFCAQISVNNKRYNLGRYVTLEEATQAYIVASIKYFDQFYSGVSQP